MSLLTANGQPITPETNILLVVLNSGQHIIVRSDGQFWHYPTLVLLQPGPGGQMGVGFNPFLFLYRDKTKMPAALPGQNGVLHVGEPDPDLARTYESHIAKQRAAAAGLVTAGSLPEAPLGGLSVSGGRRG